MDTTTDQQYTLTPQQKDRFITVWAVVGLLSLLPIVVLAWLVVLSGERGSRCLEYGEQCSAIPGSALYTVFWLALATGVGALVWPRARWRSARAGAVWLQWGAQLTLGAMILNGA
ncbi:hypothetical protein BIV25_36910 [Streptomyces sp. MUSC 14]|uniref:hypothetical protein n=1 Tax=Streptomyces sp. MUSC 14 TaxID=1354889 RepID=UPI0008F5E647|nr:hypothetical protein [Streptomyces sp. MUSC 14]OIJ88533.1 hypothetical protein BIV25_36910 [Streptomyces sp. MUSC 14]